ncbi:MAG: ribbon-helix-helix protein, CopG family [Acidimicrobiales bacterium]
MEPRAGGAGLTEDQERALDARARAAGVSRSAVVRDILDRELALSRPIDAETEVLVGQVADAYLDAVGALYDDDPDLRIER